MYDLYGKTRDGIPSFSRGAARLHVLQQPPWLDNEDSSSFGLLPAGMRPSLDSYVICNLYTRP